MTHVSSHFAMDVGACCDVCREEFSHCDGSIARVRRVGGDDGGVTCACSRSPRCPVRLACGHVFCKLCVARTAVAGSEVSLTHISCPMCREHTHIRDPRHSHEQKRRCVWYERDRSHRRCTICPLAGESMHGAVQSEKRPDEDPDLQGQYERVIDAYVVLQSGRAHEVLISETDRVPDAHVAWLMTPAGVATTTGALGATALMTLAAFAAGLPAREAWCVAQGSCVSCNDNTTVLYALARPAFTTVAPRRAASDVSALPESAAMFVTYTDVTAASATASLVLMAAVPWLLQQAHRRVVAGTATQFHRACGSLLVAVLATLAAALTCLVHGILSLLAFEGLAAQACTLLCTPIRAAGKVCGSVFVPSPESLSLGVTSTISVAVRAYHSCAILGASVLVLLCLAGYTQSLHLVTRRVAHDRILRSAAVARIHVMVLQEPQQVGMIDNPMRRVLRR